MDNNYFLFDFQNILARQMGNTLARRILTS